MYCSNSKLKYEYTINYSENFKLFIVHYVHRISGFELISLDVSLNYMGTPHKSLIAWSTIGDIHSDNWGAKLYHRNNYENRND